MKFIVGGIMTIEELRTAPLNKLIELLYVLDTQDKLNIVIYEITCRMYVPFSDVSFDELLIKNGYVPKQPNKDKRVDRGVGKT